MYETQVLRCGRTDCIGGTCSALVVSRNMIRKLRLTTLTITGLILMMATTTRANELPVKERRVSAKVAERLRLAARALRFVKRAVPYAGNQLPALLATKGNSYFRSEMARELWIPARVPSTQKLADSDKLAAQAAVIACTRGGRCGENAALAFHYLKGLGTNQTITSAGVKGVDHAFVLIGDLKKDPLREIVVVDPWVTKAQPILFSDFVFKKKRSEIEAFDVAQKLTKEEAKRSRQARRTLTRALRKSLKESPHPSQTKTVQDPSALPGIWNQSSSAHYKFRYLVRDGWRLKPLRLTSVFTKIYPYAPPEKVRRTLWQKITSRRRTGRTTTRSRARR